MNAKEKLRGTTPLMWAAEQSHPAAVKLLVEQGADVGGAVESGARSAARRIWHRPPRQRGAEVDRRDAAAAGTRADAGGAAANTRSAQREVAEGGGMTRAGVRRA